MSIRKTRGTTQRQIVEAARRQRRVPTPMEIKLWEALRDRRLEGLKFRRQHPLSRFILDAFCVEHQLEVEIDGLGHLEPVQAAYDQARSEYLQSVGIRVLRFSNAAVREDLEGVLATILAATRAG
jgi:very-short-patch-repair endonuclease